MDKPDRFVNFTRAAEFFVCTPPAITKAVRVGGVLHSAVVEINEKRKINLHHPDAQNWRQAERLAAEQVDVPTMTGVDPVLEEKVRKYLDYTVRDILNKFGTMKLWADLLTAADKIEKIHSQRLQSDRSTGELISRRYVKTRVLGMYERIFLELLSDLPTTLASEVHNMCEIGGTLEEVQQTIHNSLSRAIATVKDDTVKEIRNATE